MVLFEKVAIASVLLLAYSVIETQGWGACFYTQTNYQGTEVCDGGNVNLWPGPYNDRFKSLKVIPGETVIMFGDDTFHGYGTTASQDVPDLAAIGMGGLSSYITDNAACFYTQANQGGDPYCYSSSIDLYREAPWLNDQFKSAKVPAGRQVVIFKDDAYHGYGALVSSGDIDLERYISDGISSLIVTPAPQ